MQALADPRHPLLLYRFDEGTGTTVHDTSNRAPILDLEIQDPASVRWLNSGLAIDASTIIASADTPSELTEAMQATNAITVETWIVPANTSQGGPSRIVTFSKDSSYRNFTLGQSGSTYNMRLRTTAADRNGLPSLKSSTSSVQTTLSHVVFTRNSTGERKLFVDGIEQGSGEIGGDLSNWYGTPHRLALANELTGNRPWLGELYYVALYEQALSETEVQTHFTAGPNGDSDPPSNQGPELSAITHDATDVDPATTGLQVYDGTTVTYAASATDAETDPLTWDWLYRVNGGSAIPFLSGSGPIQSAVFTSTMAPANYEWIIRVDDGTKTTEQRFTVNVLARNLLPIAHAGDDQNVSLTSGQTHTTVSFDGSGSIDVDGQIIAYRWTGTPDPADVVTPQVTIGVGTHTFTLEVEDNQGAIQTNQVRITVNAAPNTPPTATNDSATTQQGTAVTIHVLTNDADDDGDLLTISGVTQGNNGIVGITETILSYTPTGNFSGSDTFTYTIVDGQGGRATGAVTVTVEASNVAPVAVDDVVSTPKSTPVTISVLTNDSDVDGDNLTIMSATQGANGEVSVSGQTIIYLPKAPFIGTDLFSYTINDGQGGTAIATVTVTVAVKEGEPILLSIEAEHADHNISQNPYRWIMVPSEKYSGGIAMEATPKDGMYFSRGGTSSQSPQLDFEIMFPQPGLYYVWLRAYGSNGANDAAHIGLNGQEHTINDEMQGNQGSVNWSRQTKSRSDETIDVPSAGKHTVNVWMREDGVVFDKLILTTDETYVPIETGPDATVSAFNVAPMAVHDTASTPQGSLVNLDVLTNDSDADMDDLRIVNVSQGAHGNVTTDGVALTYVPHPSFTGTDRFTYTINDGQGGMATAPVTVTVEEMGP